MGGAFSLGNCTEEQDVSAHEAAPAPPAASATSGFPIAQLREDTPGVNSVVHFNNAGCSLPPQPVLQAEIEYLKLEATIGG